MLSGAELPLIPSFRLTLSEGSSHALEPLHHCTSPVHHRCTVQVVQVHAPLDGAGRCRRSAVAVQDGAGGANAKRCRTVQVVIFRSDP